MRSLRSLGNLGIASWLLALPLTAWADHHEMASGSSSHWEEALAVRVEVYLGAGFLDVDPGNDGEAFEGGGSGSLAWAQDNFYGQFDLFGDGQAYDDRSDASTVGFGLHGGLRDPELGSVGAILAFNGRENGNKQEDIFRIGAEGEFYVDQLTLDASLGYADAEILGEKEDAFFFDLGVDFYPDDNVRLEFGGGLAAPDDTDDLGFVNGGIEIFLGEDVPISFFGRWEVAFLDDSSLEIEQHSVVIGAKFYWGGGERTLMGYDRNQFQRSCFGFPLLSRVC